MSQSQSIEEVMQRIRAQVGGVPKAIEQIKRPPQPDEVGTAASMEQQRQPGTAPQQDRREGRRDLRPFTLKLHELGQLRSETSIALDGTRQFGQINPRLPGLINNGLQLVKKAMRRSLTWYTRPQHQFQGGVVRALDQIFAILDNHNDSFRKVMTEFAKQASEIEQDSAVLAKFQERVEQESATRERQIRVVDEKAESLERQTTSLEHRGVVLEGKFGDSVKALEAKLDDSAKILEAKLHDVSKGLEAKLRDSDSANDARVVAAMAAHAAALATALSPQSQRIEELSRELESLRAELHKTRTELRESNSRGRRHDRDVRRTLNVLQNGPAPATAGGKPTPPMFASEVKSDKEFDYFAFEDLYRGEEADIRSRQKEYLEYFRGRENVVDIGCGRGEFLELLRDNQIPARGVELGLDQYLLCKEKGLEVVQADLFTFLESLPDESLGGLFSAQVIEHLTASDQLRYVALAYRKTQPGSPVIFETINAQCVYAVMKNFFLDPTHVRPVHPETLKFAMETMQFKNVELRFSGPVSDKQIPPLKLNGDTPQLEAFNRSMRELNDLIYGYQDFAAIGWH